MDRLNYFNPYQSKGGTHEDQLTRAYLVLLKHSSHAFFTFMEYLRARHNTVENEELISILNVLEVGWEIDTQRGNPQIRSNYCLSVLITDAHQNLVAGSVQASDRNARYDGIITFGNHLTIIIENKPRSGNVWFDQLNPSRQNLAEGTQVYANPTFLEWKEIIKQLNHLLSIPTMTGYEKMMAEDFLSFVDENFPYLNPYDSFHQCKGNYELLNRRVHNILKSIVLSEGDVKYHRGWGYYIKTPYSQIQQIGLILSHSENSWSIELSLFYGDSQRQAIAFYKSDPDVNHLKNTDWEIRPNFHVSFVTTNLVWFNSPDSDHYLQFWRDNVGEIYQEKRDRVPDYIQWLVDSNIINVTPEVKERLDEKFYGTDMSTLNMCPGFGLIYIYEAEEAIELDRLGKLKLDLAEKIREGLKVIGLDGNDLLKVF